MEDGKKTNGNSTYFLFLIASHIHCATEGFLFGVVFVGWSVVSSVVSSVDCFSSLFVVSSATCFSLLSVVSSLFFEVFFDYRLLRTETIVELLVFIVICK